MKKWSLRIQITLAVGLIVTAACFVLTVNSIYSANQHYMEYLALNDAFGPPDSLAGTDAAAGHEKVPDSADSSYDSASIEADSVTVTDIMRSFSTQGLEVMALTAAVSLLFTWWATGRLVKPLERLTEQLRTIDEKKLDQPVEVKKGTKEIFQLSESFNDLLARLDASFQVQKRFAADAAHELKTPIAGMKTSLQVLQMDEEPQIKDYQEFVQDADDCLGRLSQTVDSLLAMAGGSKILEHKPVPLKSTLKKVLSDLKEKAAGQDVSLSLEAPEELTVPGSPVLFQRVLFNVAENAVKYNHRGGSVCIALHRAGNMAAVEVADSGMGISKEHLSEVFQPFYRVDPSRSQDIEGSGLGLAIAASVMERYQGKIRVDSIPGKGTTVLLQFPIVEIG